MKNFIKLLFCILVIIPTTVFCQVQIKSDFVSSSPLKDKKGNQYGEGSLFKLSGKYTIPIYTKKDSLGKLNIWHANITGTYAKLDNKNLRNQTIPSEVVNFNTTVVNVRNLNESWYMINSIGLGIYSEINNIKLSSLLVNGASFFVYKVKDNLDLGAGLAVTTSYGTPMVIPAMYVNWRFSGDYQFNLNVSSTVELSASRSFNKNFKLRLVGVEMDGLSSVMKVDGKSKVYSSVMIKSYLSPEYKIGKSFSIFGGAGFALTRSSRITDRSLKAFWDTFKNKDDRINFKRSQYYTIGLKYKL